MGIRRWCAMPAQPPLLIALLIAYTAGVRGSFVTERNPRLFYVSSATSTSLATTQCYIANTDVCNCANGACNGNNINTACPTCAFQKRRRRALPDDVDQVDMTKYEDSFQSTIEDMEDTEENSMRREAKALLYWVTTTSTFTWYTSTSTIATIECTPSGFTISR